MLLVSGSTRSVGRLAQWYPDTLGHLLTPANRNSVSATLATGLWWGVDNGAFSGFDPVAFRRLCQKCHGKPRLLWVVCPDVVADAAATLERFEEWEPELRALGLPVAFVGQDGGESMDLPWERFSCFFVGGSTEWKLSRAAAKLITQARHRKKWVHMGRVNSLKRCQVAFDLGCHSVDGSSFSAFGDKYIHRTLKWIECLKRQPVWF